MMMVRMMLDCWRPIINPSFRSSLLKDNVLVDDGDDDDDDGDDDDHGDGDDDDDEDDNDVDDI